MDARRKCWTGRARGAFTAPDARGAAAPSSRATQDAQRFPDRPLRSAGASPSQCVQAGGVHGRPPSSPR